LQLAAAATVAAGMGAVRAAVRAAAVVIQVAAAAAAAALPLLRGERPGACQPPGRCTLASVTRGAPRRP